MTCLRAICLVLMELTTVMREELMMEMVIVSGFIAWDVFFPLDMPKTKMTMMVISLGMIMQMMKMDMMLVRYIGMLTLDAVWIMELRVFMMLPFQDLKLMESTIGIRAVGKGLEKVFVTFLFAPSWPCACSRCSC